MDPLELCVTTNKKNPIPIKWRNKGISFYQSNQSLNNINASVISWPFPHGCNYCNTIMTWSDGILLSLHRIDGPILGPSILGSTRALFLYGSSVMRSQANSSENSASLSPWDRTHGIMCICFLSLSFTFLVRWCLEVLFTKATPLRDKYGQWLLCWLKRFFLSSELQTILDPGVGSCKWDVLKKPSSALSGLWKFLKSFTFSLIVVFLSF